MEKIDSNSRRLFLTKSAGLFGALLFPWDILKADFIKSGHILEEGVLFPHNELPRIKSNIQHPVFKKYWESLLNADLKAEAKFMREELNIRKHFQHMIKCCDILKRSSLVSLIEERKDHEDIAKLAIEKIHTFDVWDYITEGGKDFITFQCAPEAIIAFSIAIDLMTDKLSSADKEDMLKAIAEKGAKPCYLSLFGMRYPKKVKGWAFDPREEIKTNVDLSKWPYILARTNLRMIPITGLILSSLMLKDKDPETEKWMEMALWSMKDFSTMWEKDGCYSEGFGYSSYSTKHIILAIDFLNRVSNNRYDNIINFKGYTKFILGMSAPFKNYPFGSINFGDNAFSVDSTLLYWIASKFSDGLSQYTAIKFPSQVNIFALAWFNGSIKEKEPGQEMMDIKYDNDWVVSRSGYTEDDTVLAIRSGGPANHEHADRNSIILNACGERFFHDPLGAAYNNFDKHWLLRQTEAHSSVLIDGKGHQYHDGREGTNASKAVAKIVQYKPGKKLTIISSDATPAYKLVNEDIKRVQRTLALIKPNALIIIDEIQKIKNPSKVQLRFQAFNVDKRASLKYENDNQTFEIIRPNGNLIAKCNSLSRIKISDGKIDVPEDKGIFPYIQVENEESKNIIIITACAMNPGTLKASEIEITKKESKYNITIKNEGNKYTLEVKTGDKYPSIKFI